MKKRIVGQAVALLFVYGTAFSAQTAITSISDTTASRQALREAVNVKLGVVEGNRQDHETRVAAIEAVIGDRPWVVQAAAPADTTLAWFDTDQVASAFVLKIHNGTAWVQQAIGESGSGTGDITDVVAGTGLSGGATSGSATLNLANTTVTAGSYTYGGFTVDAQGRITAASSGTTPLTAYPSSGLAVSTGSAWGTSFALDTDISSVSANHDSVPSAKATKTALDLKANATGTSFVAAALSDLKYDPNTSVADDEYPLITNTGSVGDTNDATVVPTLERAGTLFQAADPDLATWAGVTSSSNGRSLVSAADYAAMRGLLDLEAGTDFYAKTAIDTQGEVETIWAVNITNTIASGTATLGTSAIANGACASVVTVSATGVATTDIINPGFSGTPVGVTGYDPTSVPLNIIAYPTANNVNFLVCNKTGASVTPGALTINWRVDR